MHPQYKQQDGLNKPTVQVPKSLKTILSMQSQQYSVSSWLLFLLCIIIIMFTIKLNTLLLKRLTHNTTYPIIAELFRKKSQASANNNKPTPPPEEEEHQKNDELKEMED